MLRTISLFAVFAAVTAMVWPGAAQVQAQETAPVALTSANIGMVDITRIGQEYTSLLEKNKTLENLLASRKSELDIRQSYRFLTEEEMQELLKLLALKEPTPEQKSRAQELADLSQKRDAELLALDTKENLTPEEKARRSELRQLQTAADQKTQELAAAYTAEMQQERQKIEGNVIKAVRKAVTEVATEMGLPIVLDKDAILFGGTDITDQVLKKLNAATPAPAAGEGATEGAAGAEATTGESQ